MSKQREIDQLLEDILVDAYGEDEQLWALRQTFEEEVPLPTEGSIIGETVLVNKLGVKKQDSARCRLLGKDKELTLRSADVWDVVSGEIVTVLPRKHWSYAGHPYLSADITGTRFDLGALNLQPLKLNDFGMWDPGQHYWGEDVASTPMRTWEIWNSTASRRRRFVTMTLAGKSAKSRLVPTFPVFFPGD